MTLMTKNHITWADLTLASFAGGTWGVGPVKKEIVKEVELVGTNCTN